MKDKTIDRLDTDASPPKGMAKSVSGYAASKKPELFVFAWMMLGKTPAEISVQLHMPVERVLDITRELANTKFEWNNRQKLSYADAFRNIYTRDMEEEEGRNKRIYRRAAELKHPDLPPKNEKNRTKTKVTLRFYDNLIEQVDRAVENARVQGEEVDRNAWIASAITAKLQM